MPERIDNDALYDGLMEATVEVMEDAAFVFASPADEPLKWGNDAIAVRVALSGEINGWIQLRALPGFGQSLAENLLGAEDPSEMGIDARDALGEMLNMVAGVTLEKWFGSGQNVQLGVPLPPPGPGDGWSVAVGLMSDDGDPIEMSATVQWH